MRSTFDQDSIPPSSHPSAVYRTIASLVLLLVLSACVSTREDPREAREAARRRVESETGIELDENPGRKGGRHLETVVLPFLEFKNPLPPITAPIELCISEALRRRQWSVGTRPYRVRMGPLVKQNVELLVKKAFSDVTVVFPKECHPNRGRDSITIDLVAARRDRYGTQANGEQRTMVLLETTVYASDDSKIWSKKVEKIISRPSALGGNATFPELRIPRLVDIVVFPLTLYVNHERNALARAAARDFGEVLELALQSTFDEIVASGEIRNALASRGGQPQGLLPN